MVDQIGANRVVALHRECDLQLRTDAIDTCDQHRFPHSGKVGCEQPTEAADFSENFRAVGFANAPVDAFFDDVPEINVHACARVSFFCHVNEFETSLSLSSMSRYSSTEARSNPSRHAAFWTAAIWLFPPAFPMNV